MTAQAERLPDSFDTALVLRQRAARRRWWFIAAIAAMVPALVIVTSIASVIVWLGVRHRTAMHDVQKERSRPWANQ
jgi:hypothetical protein